MQHLKVMDLCREFKPFDIEPAHKDVASRDALFDFPDEEYGNLYQYALDNCLTNCSWVVALIPESFIRTRLFRKRLRTFISVTQCLFTETGHPVELALLGPHKTADTKVWISNTYSGKLTGLESCFPSPRRNGVAVRFNDPS